MSQEIFVDRQSAEYRALVEERAEAKLFGKDYDDIRWIDEFLSRLKSTPPDLDHSRKDYADFEKALYLMRRLVRQLGRKDNGDFSGYTYYGSSPSGGYNDSPADDGASGATSTIGGYNYYDTEPRVPAGETGGGEWTTGDAMPASQMSVSDTGIQAISQYEIFRAHTYLDTGEHPTIGYGHKLLPGESFPDGITEEQGQALLRQDVSTAENAVRRQVTANLTQPQFDALVSFTFNAGASGLSKSDVLLHTNTGNFDAAVNAFSHFTRSGNDPTRLTNRRNAEATMFRSGIPK